MDFNLYNHWQILDEVVDVYGDYDTIEKVFALTGQGSLMIMQMVKEFETGDDVCSGDVISWFIEGNTAFDAVEWLEEQGESVRELILQVAQEIEWVEEDDPNGKQHELDAERRALNNKWSA